MIRIVLSIVVAIIVLGGAYFAWMALAPVIRHRSISTQSPLAQPVTPQSTGDILVKYDKFKNATEVSAGGFKNAKWNLLRQDVVSGQWVDDGSVYFGLQYDFDGQSISSINCGPMLMFVGNVHDDDQVIFLADGSARYNLVVPMSSGPVPSGEPTGWLSVHDATAIEHAQSVEVEIGTQHFKLRPEQQQALAAFLKDLGAE